ncbi:hypothetical protein Bca4012_076482 [Brassica carinata]
MTILARRYKAMGLSMQDVLFLGNDVSVYAQNFHKETTGESKRVKTFLPVFPQELAELIAAIKDGTISGKIGKQITDPVEMEKMVMKVFSKSPKQLEQYRSGRTKLQGFFCWPGNETVKRQKQTLLYLTRFFWRSSTRRKIEQSRP